MARMRSTSSIENEIMKIERELAKIQAKHDLLTEKLLDLQKQKQAYETKQIMDAFRKSGKSRQELMRFPQWGISPD